MRGVGTEFVCLEAAISTVWGLERKTQMSCDSNYVWDKIKEEQSNITTCGNKVSVKRPQI